MIDFIKISIHNDSLVQYFYNHSLLYWHSKNEHLSSLEYGTIHTREVKKYKGIAFCFYNQRLDIIMKPHYYYNNDYHNANDFTVSNCISVLSEFVEAFNLNTDDLEAFRIVNLEYGLNAQIPFAIEDFISWIYAHQKLEFVNDRGLAYSKRAVSVGRDGKENTYKLIKIYAKSIQYPLYCESNTLRFEVKSKKSSFISALGIKTLRDLLVPETYEVLANNLKNEFKSILILDAEARFDNLSKVKKRKLKEYLNTNTWYKHLQSSNRNKFTYHKARYFELLNKTNKNIHTDMLKIISSKLKQLKSDAHFPTKENNINYNLDPYFPMFMKVRIDAYFPTSIGVICTKRPISNWL